MCSVVMGVVPHMQRAAKRECRRLVATSDTVCRVPAETWVIICRNLYFSPHTVYRLMMACKPLYTALSRNDEWWNTFMLRIVQYQECLDHSNIRHRLLHLTYRLKYSPRLAIQLVCSPRCAKCGARFGHHIFKPMRCRICAQCLQAALVSNRVLTLRYGIDVADFIVAYAAAGGVVIPLNYYQNDGDPLTHMAKLSCDPVDFAGRSPVMFLVRADVERVLGVRLEPDAVVAQRARAAAARTLAACIRRTHVMSRLRSATATRPVRLHRIRKALTALANNDLRRVLAPVGLPDGFVLGGPMCAMSPCGCRNATRLRAHLTPEDVSAVSRHMYAPLGFSSNPACQLWL